MIKVVRVAEMVAIEKEADAHGLTYARMMEKAGFNLAEALQDTFNQLMNRRVLGLVGSGNNGGDTLVALAHLARHGWHATVYLVRARQPGDALVERLKLSGGEVISVEDDHEFTRLNTLLGSNAVILDGVLGTGVKLPLREETSNVLSVASKRLAALRDVHVVAVDCPSGVDCDTGEVAPECIPAEVTISMAAAKQGMFIFPAANYVGDLRYVGIGLGEVIPFPAAWQKISRFVVDHPWVSTVLPARPLDAHKGTFGTALVAAGSLNYSGAALLAGKAAYISGAGLVTLAVPRSLHTALAGHLPEATWQLLPEENGCMAEAGASLLIENLGRATALLVGPGFGLAAGTGRFMRALLSAGAQLPPMVVDADGLKLLVQVERWAERLPVGSILTPHPGEMSILTGLPIEQIQKERVEIAEHYARKWGHIVVLKGAFTVVASPDGRTGIVPVATPALARAGTGDVLAGLITGLKAQDMPAFEAAAAGAWIHARAGLRAAEKLGSSAATLAGDVLRMVVEILAKL